MALHKVKEGNGWKILNDREFEHRENNLMIGGCLWGLVRLGLGAYIGLRLWEKFGNANVSMCVFLASIIVTYIVMGKIGKRVLRSPDGD